VDYSFPRKALKVIMVLLIFQRAAGAKFLFLFFSLKQRLSIRHVIVEMRATMLKKCMLLRLRK
jgi:hypothetical protein